MYEITRKAIYDLLFIQLIHPLWKKNKLEKNMFWVVDFTKGATLLKSSRILNYIAMEISPLVEMQTIYMIIVRVMRAMFVRKW